MIETKFINYKCFHVRSVAHGRLVLINAFIETSRTVRAAVHFAAVPFSSLTLGASLRAFLSLSSLSPLPRSERLSWRPPEGILPLDPSTLPLSEPSQAAVGSSHTWRGISRPRVALHVNTSSPYIIYDLRRGHLVSSQIWHSPTVGP